jgi:diguanylate cyclase (GGDEF)-like protein
VVAGQELAVTGDRPDLPYAAIFTATPASLLVLTPDLTICDATDAYLKAVGRSREEVVGRYIFEVFPEAPDPAGNGVPPLRASLERARDTGQPDTMAVHRFDIRVVGGQFEERYWIPIQVPILDEHGDTVLLLHRAEDVTDYVRERQQRPTQETEADLFARAHELQVLNAELRTARDALVARSLRDPMTDLLIRPVILEQLSRALARIARHPQAVAVLFLDLDRLKQVNDRYGHAAGDELIRCFAESLRSSIRPSDSVARFGGDEFVVLLEGLRDGSEAEAVATRVLEATRTCDAPESLPVRPSASVGVAVTTSSDMSVETLISRADQAMYQAKQAGGDRYQVFDAGQEPRSAATASR